MGWLRFSLRSLLIATALAALGSLALRQFVDRPFERVEKVMTIIWRDSPQAEIYYAPNGHFFVKGARRLSPEAARALREAELIIVGQVHCGDLPALEFDEQATDELRRGFEYVGWFLSRSGVAFCRGGLPTPQHADLDFDLVLAHPVNR